MKEVAAAGEADQTKAREPIEHPERVLEEDERRWVESHGPFGRAITVTVFYLLALILRTIFRLERGRRPARGGGRTCLRASGGCRMSNPENTDDGSASRRELRAWISYDWANRSFATVIQNFIFAACFTHQIAAVADHGARRKPWLVSFAVVCAAATGWLILRSFPATDTEGGDHGMPSSK